MTNTDTVAPAAAPWTVEQLAELLPDWARIEPTRWGIHADWTTAAGTWTFTASWHTHRATHVAIHGPHVSTTLTDPAVELVEASLAVLGALGDTKPVPCPHPGCLVSTNSLEQMDHHLAARAAVQAWRHDNAEGETAR